MYPLVPLEAILATLLATAVSSNRGIAKVEVILARWVLSTLSAKVGAIVALVATVVGTAGEGLICLEIVLAHVLVMITILRTV